MRKEPLEELVTFETATLAKDKGFKMVATTYEYGIDGEIGHRNYIPHDYNIRGLVSAPTQAILQRWLRNEYKIYVLPSPTSSTKDGAVSKWFFTLNQDHPSANKEIYYFESETIGKTYEEALEEGLKEGLKLIKI